MQTSAVPSFAANWLARQPGWVVALWAAGAAFCTYFAMYAFRKPFTAAAFDGQTLADSAVALKTAFVVAQLVGYTISKYLGVRVCSQLGPARRMAFLIGLIVAAQLTLVAFGSLPPIGKVLAMFLNGLPLGMVWGVVVTYLEGRRASEVMLAVLSCSFIVSSGIVKDVGRWVMNAWGVSEAWMPATVGLAFLPLFAISVWMLDQTPGPTDADRVERCERTPMQTSDRVTFVRRFGPGLFALLGVYLCFTAYRDFRDNFGIEIFGALGYGDRPAIFTQTELPVAFGVLAVLALLSLIRDNRNGLLGAWAVMGTGALLVGGSTWAFTQGHISGAVWMVCNGLGSYFTYVPFGSVLFDRIIAYTRVGGTAVFAIYLADAVGYTGSIGLQLFKDVFAAGTTRLEFFIAWSYVSAAVGVVLLAFSLLFFLRQGARATASTQES